MNPPRILSKGFSAHGKQLLWCIPVVIIGALVWFANQPTRSPKLPKASAEVVVVPRAQLELRSARLYQIAATNTFNGWMVERYPEGALRSRSAVTNGLLHGISQGWHTNGQLQVVEHFKEGVSHGVRAKWYADGTKFSEARIVEGQLNGPFRRWHENGSLAEDVEMRNGQADGLARAYFASGFVKSQSTLRNGKVIEHKFWNDGEFQEASHQTF